MTEEIKYQQPKLKIIDSREPSEMRSRMIELGWESRQLFSADYWFFTHDYKKVGIERKEIGDLFSSLAVITDENTGDKKSGRLTTQLENMIEHYDFPILLIEGNWRQVSEGKIISARGIEYYSWSMIWNYIRSQQHKGITIELTLSMNHSIKRLNELYAWYQKPFHTGGLNKNTYSDDRILAFPSGCRGKTAMNVLEVFKSLLAVANADKEDFLNVEGIGEKKANLIWNHFNRGLDLKEVEVVKEEEKEIIEKEDKEEKTVQGKLL